MATRDRIVHAQAPGKINLFFEVGQASEDGYHDVASVYQAVSLVEDVWARPADEITVRVKGVTTGVPLDDRNLAVRAARLLAEETGYRGGVRLDIRKKVPVAGGMGGGSADAAAALVACDALWGTGLTPAQLRELGSRLGADVPFALLGGNAVGVGRGDVVSPGLSRGRYDWVLVIDQGGLPTSEVFAALDAQRARAAFTPRPRVPQANAQVLRALRAGDATLLAGALRNDLQAAALQLNPALARVLDIGMAAGALGGLVSGSGPTVAFLAAAPEAAIDLQIQLSAAGFTALHVHGAVSGARIVLE